MKKILVVLFILLIASVFFYPHETYSQAATFTKQVINQGASGDDKAVADIYGNEKADGILADKWIAWAVS